MRRRDSSGAPRQRSSRAPASGAPAAPAQPWSAQEVVRLVFAACALAGRSLPGGEMLHPLTDAEARTWGWTALNYAMHVNAGLDASEARRWFERASEVIADKAFKATEDYVWLQVRLGELNQEGSK